MSINWGKRITAALFAALVLTTSSSAIGASWPTITPPVSTGTGGTIVIDSSILNSGKTITGTTSGATWDEVNRGGGAVVVLPALTGTPITSISASNLTVSGYNTTVTADTTATYSTNAFGPMVVFGSKYAATATNMTGYASDGTSTTSTYVTDVTYATFRNLNLQSNITTLKVQGANSADSSAFGGAARFANLPGFVYDGGTISGNTIAVVSDNAGAAMTQVHANGGGFVIENDFGGTTATLSNLVFSNNTASVAAGTGFTDPGASSNARGGAIYVAGYNNEKQTAASTAADNTGLELNVSKTTFSGNKAVNSGAAASGAAAGGAVFTNLAVKSTFTDVAFSGNSAESSHSNALGGAVAMVFADNYTGSGSTPGTLTPLTDRTSATQTYFADFNRVQFTNNAAKSGTAGAAARGGAIYTDKSILLSEVNFSGNSIQDYSGTILYTNAIHLEGAATEAIFYDVAGKKSTDNDGISGAGNIRKLGDGELELFGTYNGTTAFTGNVYADEGAVFFQGGANQVFAGGIDIANGAEISMLRTKLTTAATVRADVINADAGSTITARALNKGDSTTLVNSNETAHFVADTTLLANQNATYKVAGEIVENEQYIIATQSGAVLDGLGLGANNLGTQNGLFGDYTVYSNAADDAVWAEMDAGTGRTLADYATTINNRNIASSITNGSQLYDYIISQGYDASNAVELNNIYRLATNEIAASTVTAILGHTMRGADLILGQARTAWWEADIRDYGSYGTASTASNSGLAAAALNCVSRGPRIWAEFDGYYNRGRDNEDTYRGKTRSYGVAAGMDMVVGDWLVGGGFRYGDSRLKVDALASRADYDSYSFSAYVGRRFQFSPGTLHVTGGYSYSYHDIDSTRRDILNGSYKSNYNGKSHTAYLDADFAINTCSFWTIAPYANAIFNSFRNDEFTEKQYGGASDPLTIAARTKSNLSTSLGFRLKADLGSTFFVDATGGWRHTYGNLTPANRTMFVSTGARFSVLGNALARDEAVYGAGIGVKMSDKAMLRAGYDGSYGDRTFSHKGNVSFSLWF